ncbi:MAG: hypothetical protein ACO1O6_15155 [Bacteroidota bacterium]
MYARKGSSALQDKLKLSNEELLSSWMQLASIIYHYEGVNWYKAQQKAKSLFTTVQAVDYLQSVRFNVQAGNFRQQPPPESASEAREIFGTVRAQEDKLNKYEKNFNKLLQIAPDLERVLYSDPVQQHGRLEGEAKTTGYKTVCFDLVRVQSEQQFIFVLSELAFDENGPRQKLKVTLLLDFEKRRLEALRIEDDYCHEDVYNDLYERRMLDPVQKQQQNAFLKDWLKKLDARKYRFQWEDTLHLVDLDQRRTQARQDAERYRAEQQAEEERQERQREFEEMQEQRRKEEEAKLLRRIKSHAEYLDEEELQKHVDFDLDYFENLARVEKADNRKKLQHSFEDLGAENFRLLNELMPELKERLAYRHSKGNFVTPLAAWLVVRAKTRGTDCMQFVLSKFSKENEKLLAPALIAVDFKKEKVWLVANAKGFYGMEDFSEGEQQTEAIRLKHNFELYKLLESFGGEDCEFDWYNKPSDSEVPDFELGRVQLCQAHTLEGIGQRHIDWINQHGTGLRVALSEDIDKSSMTHEEAIWYMTHQPPVRLEPNGQIIPYDYASERKKAKT